jgi:hypothetical protein
MLRCLYTGEEPGRSLSMEALLKCLSLLDLYPLATDRYSVSALLHDVFYHCSRFKIFATGTPMTIRDLCVHLAGSVKEPAGLRVQAMRALRLIVQGPRIPHSLDGDPFHPTAMETKHWARPWCLQLVVAVLDTQATCEEEVELKVETVRFVTAFADHDRDVAQWLLKVGEDPDVKLLDKILSELNAAYVAVS